MLNIEVNVVYFPLEEHKGTGEKPKFSESDAGAGAGEVPEKEEKWTAEKRAAFLLQRAEVHLIKIGPITEEFLSLKKLNPALDFLEGVKFTLTDDNDYLWTSGEELKGLPISSKYQLLAALQRMGYTDACYNDQIPQPTDQSTNGPLTKLFYALNKKY